MKCPHKDIRFCPLYHAAHESSRYGCDDGELGYGECAIARGMIYKDAVAGLKVEKPALVEQLKFKEDAEERWAQTARNMRLLGIH